jgi:hypothetical protein
LQGRDDVKWEYRIVHVVDSKVEDRDSTANLATTSWFLLTFADGKRPGSLGGTTEYESQSPTDSGLPFDEAVVRCDGSQFQPDRGSGHQRE